ncbi:ferroxidase fet3 [Coemansia sp. RSA 2336]|nr:ferroxidase fet3 [Coemansia sp. RSA 2336]
MSSMAGWLTVLLLCLVQLCLADIVRVDWDVGYVQVNRDGYINRRAIGVNGALPIPPVYMYHGDTLLLTVRNSLDMGTSIHAHGLYQNGSAYMDGAGMVTQCGIPPGESFTYRIYAEQVGTYWLHGHYHSQNADGLRTPLIIQERRPAYKYDEEMLFFLEDWYPTEAVPKMQEVLAPSPSGLPPPPTFPYGLINGYNGNDTKPIRFRPGGRYRIRVVNMATTEWWKFTIPGHKLEVIEADGVVSHPHVVDGLDLAPGQRYSAIVTAHDTAEFNYMYNCTLYADFVPWIAGLNPRHYLGLVEYHPDAPVKHIATPDDNLLKWANDIEMRALDGAPAMPVDRQIELKTRGYVTTDQRNLRELGTAPYTDPQKVPTLFTAMSMGELASDPRVYGPQSQAIVIPHNQRVEILLKNVQALPHPMHQHSVPLQIVERGPVDPSEIEIAKGINVSASDLPRITRRTNYENPMLRDTFNVPPFEYVKLRFQGTVPGCFVHHCHVQTHFVAGLAATFVVAPEVLQKTQRIPDEMLSMCTRQGMKAEGNVMGNWGYDLTGLSPVPVEQPGSFQTLKTT